MAGKKKSLHLLTAIVAVTFFEFGIVPSFLAKAQSQPARLDLTDAQTLTVAQAFQPPSRETPARTADGGTRGCSSVKPGEKAMTALTPPKHLALTVAERPTLFWYVPASGGHTLEFTLLDRNDEQVLYKTTLSAPAKSGIISLSLPQNLPPLKEGQLYHWYLTMVCDPSDRTGDVVLDGWFERTAPSASLASQLQKASQRERPALYAKAGIWYESLTALAELRQNYPNDAAVAAGWKELLNSVQLGQFAEEPLINRTQTSQK